MNYRLFQFAVILFLISFSNEAFPQRIKVKVDSTLFHSEEVISLDSLLKNPDKYDNQSIKVIGTLCFNYEGNGLQMNHQNCIANEREKAIAISFNMKRNSHVFSYQNKEIIIEGIFHNRPSGHFGSYKNGGLDKI